MIKDNPLLETGWDLRENRFNQLLEEVCRNKLNPEDKYEIAAILESCGWNDRMAAEEFGASDIFDLSEQLFDAIRKKIIFVPYSYITKPTIGQYILSLIRGFLRGAIFALPMAVSVIAMLTLRFSLWSYTYLSLDDATSIAVGTILSFVAIGGFMQTIGYWGFRFIIQNQFGMARRIVFYYVKLGLLICFVIALMFLIINVLFSVFPWKMALIADTYFLFLSSIWLSVTVMYILQKELTFTGLIIGGIFSVFVLFRILKMNIILSQIISLLLVSVIGILLAVYFFLKEELRGEKGINPSLPRLSVIFHISMPYFIYGFLYFLFLFSDRVMAWSANTDYMPFLFWFRGDYELGLDLALIVLILPMGLVEAVVTDLMVNLEANQKNHRIYEISVLRHLYRNLYLKRLFWVLTVSGINSLGLYFVITRYNGGLLSRELLANPVTHSVFVIALVAYSLLSAALMNVLILFCFSQPAMVHRPVFLASSANLICGFLLSRWFHYSFAVWGLLIGALIFAVISSLQVRRLFLHLDYYLYTSL